MLPTGLQIRGGWLAVCFAASLLSACDRGSDCGNADSLEQIRRIDAGARRYHFYLRTSGFSDKTSFVVLYDQQPVFDACGRANRPPVAETVLDTDQGWPTRVTYGGGQLAVQYAPTPAGAPRPAQAIQVEILATP